PSLTIGGGPIVDDHPRRHRRFQPATLGQLEVLERGTPEEVLIQTLQRREPRDLGELSKELSLTWPEIEKLVGEQARTHHLYLLDENTGLSPRTSAISAQGWARICALVTSELESYHHRFHLRRGMSKEELRVRLNLEPRVFSRIVRLLQAEGVAHEDGPAMRLPDFVVELEDVERRIAEQICELLSSTGMEAPSRTEIASRFGAGPELLQALLDQGRLVEV